MESGGDDSVARLSRSRWRTAAAISCVLAVPIVMQVCSIRWQPVSQGMTITEWLNGGRAATEEVLKGFDASAIPYVIDEYREAEARSHIPFKALREKVFGNTKVRNAESAESRRLKALRALSVLGRKDPTAVEPFLFDLLASSHSRKRAQVLRTFGFLGGRHFQLLTNWVSSTNVADSRAAMSGLESMGTNARAVVPLIISKIFDQPNGKSDFAGCLPILPIIGPDHPLTLLTLLSAIGDSHDHVQVFGLVALRKMPNRFPIIAAEVLRVAKMPPNGTNDVGYQPTRHMAYLGVDPSDGIRLIVERLRTAMSLSDRNRFRSQIALWCEAMRPWGGNAGEAVPFLKEELLAALQRDLRAADPQSQRRIEEDVKMVEAFVEELST
ncbi:MAG: hypothetical protein ACKVHO_05590 [Verrucomicrobiia bacterium]|jgi:hypothetical protein